MEKKALGTAESVRVARSGIVSIFCVLELQKENTYVQNEGARGVLLTFSGEGHLLRE